MQIPKKCQMLFGCLLVIWLVLILSGCSSGPTIKVGAQPALVPELPAITIERPVLVIHTLDNQQKNQPDQLVKAYVASLLQLINYAQSLEQIVDALQQFHVQDYEDTAP